MQSTTSGVEGSFADFLPQQVPTLGGQPLGAWFAIDQGIWRCDAADPDDNIDAWRQVGTLSITAWAFDLGAALTLPGTRVPGFWA